jgi:HK97 family phage prohead protease
MDADIRYLTAKAEPKPDLGEGIVEALVAAYDIDFKLGSFWGLEFWERIEKGAFAESIADDAPFAVYRQHGRTAGPGSEWSAAPIGYTTKAEDTDEGPVFTMQLLIKYEEVAQTWELMLAGALREWSIGYRPIPPIVLELDEDKETEVIRKGELYEASTVLRGANPNTKTKRMRDLEARAREIRISRGEDPDAPAEEKTTEQPSLWTPETRDRALRLMELKQVRSTGKELTWA